MQSRWRIGLAAAVLGTLVAQLWLCFFFSGGELIPRTIDITPANYRSARVDFPPQGSVSYDYWLGWPSYPNPLTPHSVLAHLPPWWFFTVCYPVYGALAVLTFSLYARALGFGPMVAILGGLVYGWQGPLLSNVYGAHFAPAALLALFPLVGWGVYRAVQGRGWLPAVAGGAVLGLMICLQPDHGALVALFIGAFYLAHAGRTLLTTPRAVAPILGKLALTVVTSAAVAAPTIQSMYATQIAGIQQGGSQDPQQKWAWATQWSLPPAETLDQIVPGYFGWRSDLVAGPYWGRIGRQPGWEEHHQGFRNYSINSNTVGTVAFLLALAAVLILIRRPRQPAAAAAGLDTVPRWHGRFCVAAALVAYLLAFGRWAPFYYWFYQLPYMSTWRNPLKFLVVANFCVVSLSLFGLHWLLAAAETPEGERFRRVWRGVLVAVAVVLAALSLTALGRQTGPDGPFVRLGYDAAQAQAIRSTQLKTLLGALGVVAVLGAVLWKSGPAPAAVIDKPGRSVKRGRGPRAGTGPRLLIAAVVVTVVGQLFWVHRHYIEPVNIRQAYRSNALIDALRAAPQPVRVKIIGSDSLLHYHLTYLFPYYGIASIDIPAMSRLPDDYAAFFKELEQAPFRQWELGGVRFLALPSRLVPQLLAAPGLQGNVAGVRLFRAELVPPDGLALQPVEALATATHALVELQSYLSKATLVPGLELLENQAAVGRRLSDPGWDPRATAVVDQPTAALAGLAASPAPSAPPPTGRTALRQYTGSSIEVEVESDAPGYLLINDRFDANWRATVNGVAARPFRADLILMAVRVPAGRSTVVLRYSCPAGPVYVHLGALALCGVLLGWWLRQGDPPA